MDKALTNFVEWLGMDQNCIDFGSDQEPFCRVYHIFTDDFDEIILTVAPKDQPVRFWWRSGSRSGSRNSPEV